MEFVAVHEALPDPQKTKTPFRIGDKQVCHRNEDEARSILKAEHPAPKPKEMRTFTSDMLARS